MNRLMRFDLDINECFLLRLLSCSFAGCAWLCTVTVSLLAGSEPAVRPVFHFGMDTDDATQTSAWLEYSVWQDQEWVRIYSPGQLQLCHPEVPPTWLQYHGPSLHDRLPGVQVMDSCLHTEHVYHGPAPHDRLSGGREERTFRMTILHPQFVPSLRT